MAHNSAAVLMVGMILTAAGAHADQADTTTTRVRSENSTIVRLIAQATERSATFRREIAAINATDGLVYVHDAQCGRGVQACLMHTVELAGPYRLLRVKVDVRRPEPETMASLAHELRHVIEALSDPRVTNDARIASFFRQLAPTGRHNVETAAALQAGFDVFDELISKARPAARVKYDAGSPITVGFDAPR